VSIVMFGRELGGAHLQVCRNAGRRVRKESALAPEVMLLYLSG